MPNRFETAASRLYERQVGRCGSTVTIKRGNLTTTGVPAVLGAQLLKVTNDDGSPQTVMTDKDFLIERTAYQINSVVVEPLRGDKIVETIGDVEWEFEVLPYGDEKEFRYADEYRKVLRVHAKRVK